MLFWESSEGEEDLALGSKAIKAPAPGLYLSVTFR
jgi:hypothetical protein